MMGMAEASFTVCCLQADNGTFVMYSKSAKHTSYFHGMFDTIDEASYSLMLKCDELEIKFVRGYSQRLITEGMFQQ
jgi:hypothetical protein